MLLKELFEDASLRDKNAIKSDWDAWEEEIIADMKAGILDEWIEEAKQDYRDGKTEEI